MQRWQGVGPTVIGQAGKRTSYSDEHVNKQLRSWLNLNVFLHVTDCLAISCSHIRCLLTHQAKEENSARLWIL